MLWGGFFFMVIGRVLCIPWGPDLPKIADFGRKYLFESYIFISIVYIFIRIIYYITISTYITKKFNKIILTNVISFIAYNNITEDINGTEIVGCPITQEWCLYTPQITITQFFIGYGFTSIGYPLGVTLIQTIFSKILGPRPQGVWMGLMTGAGCASRVLGPVFVGFIYTRLGTYYTFGITGVMLIIFMLWLQIVNKRLIPPETRKDSQALNKQRKDVEIPLVHLKSENIQTSQEIEKHNGALHCDKV